MDKLNNIDLKLPFPDFFNEPALLDKKFEGFSFEKDDNERAAFYKMNYFLRQKFFRQIKDFTERNRESCDDPLCMETKNAYVTNSLAVGDWIPILKSDYLHPLDLERFNIRVGEALMESYKGEIMCGCYQTIIIYDIIKEVNF